MSMDAEVEACLLRDPLRPHGPLSSLGSPLNYIDDASFGAKKDGKKMKWVEGRKQPRRDTANRGCCLESHFLRLLRLRRPRFCCRTASLALCSVQLSFSSAAAGQAGSSAAGQCRLISVLGRLAPSFSLLHSSHSKGCQFVYV